MEKWELRLPAMLLEYLTYS